MIKIKTSTERSHHILIEKENLLETYSGKHLSRSLRYIKQPVGVVFGLSPFQIPVPRCGTWVAMLFRLWWSLSLTEKFSKDQRDKKGSRNYSIEREKKEKEQALKRNY